MERVVIEGFECVGTENTRIATNAAGHGIILNADACIVHGDVPTRVISWALRPTFHAVWLQGRHAKEGDVSPFESWPDQPPDAGIGVERNSR